MKDILIRMQVAEFERLLQCARRGPVSDLRPAGPSAVLMSGPRFCVHCIPAWDRLAGTVDSMREQAAANGLTPAVLDALLVEQR